LGAVVPAGVVPAGVVPVGVVSGPTPPPARVYVPPFATPPVVDTISPFNSFFVGGMAGQRLGGLSVLFSNGTAQRPDAGLLVGNGYSFDALSCTGSTKDSPVNGTSAPVFRLMSDS